MSLASSFRLTALPVRLAVSASRGGCCSVVRFSPSPPCLVRTISSTPSLPKFNHPPRAPDGTIQRTFTLNAPPPPSSKPYQRPPWLQDLLSLPLPIALTDHLPSLQSMPASTLLNLHPFDRRKLTFLIRVLTKASYKGPEDQKTYLEAVGRGVRSEGELEGARRVKAERDVDGGDFAKQDAMGWRDWMKVQEAQLVRRRGNIEREFAEGGEGEAGVGGGKEGEKIRAEERQRRLRGLRKWNERWIEQALERRVVIEERQAEQKEEKDWRRMEGEIRGSS